MADDRLRALKRAAEHDPVARAQWLAERQRAGELDPARLRLAAFLGDPAALELDPSPHVSPERLLDWVQLLTGFGREVFVRAARAAASHRFPSGLVDDPACAAVDAWLACPCPSHAEAARRLAGPRHTRSIGSWVAAAAGAVSLSEAAQAAVVAIVPHVVQDVWRCLDCGLHHALGDTTPPDLPLEARVRAAVEPALLAWVLGGTRAPVDGPAGKAPEPREEWPRREPRVPIPEVPLPEGAEAALDAAVAARGFKAASVAANDAPGVVQAATARLAERRHTSAAQFETLVRRASALLRRKLPWSAERLAWTLLLAKRVGASTGSLVGDLLQAAVACADANGGALTPELRAAIELHVHCQGGELRCALATEDVNARLASLLGPA